jgi:hypothetical protein
MPSVGKQLNIVLEQKYEEVQKKIFNNALLVTQEIIDILREIAPYGDGTLQESFRHIIDETLFGIAIGIYSTSEYAKRQDEGVFWHVPKQDLGKYGFAKYHSLIPDSTFDAKVNAGRLEVFDIFNTSSIKTKQQRRYWKGYLAAIDEEVAPADKYKTEYIETAIEKIGGIKYIKSQLLIGI